MTGLLVALCALAAGLLAGIYRQWQPSGHPLRRRARAFMRQLSAPPFRNPGFEYLYPHRPADLPALGDLSQPGGGQSIRPPDLATITIPRPARYYDLASIYTGHPGRLADYDRDRYARDQAAHCRGLGIAALVQR